MNRFFTLLLLLPASFAFADLTVTLDAEGCPIAVISNEESCTPGQADPRNVVCKQNGAPVRWTSAGTINSVSVKSGSPGELFNCRQAGPRFQCIVRGNSGDNIDYDITVNDCLLDPTIILK